MQKSGSWEIERGPGDEATDDAGMAGIIQVDIILIY
jgi:hypothetical protein